MNRTKEIKVRLSNDEFQHLNELVKRSDLSRESYIRSLCQGIILADKPTDEMIEIIKQLRAIGNNINQLSIVANKIGSIDIMKFKYEYEKLQKQIQLIMIKISEPKKMEVEHGNNINMGS